MPESEVQRPLATVVIFGIVGATGLMLVVFPGLLRSAFSSNSQLPSENTASEDLLKTGT